MPVFQRYGGEVLATSKKEIDVIEGDWALDRIVLMKFPNLQAARDWHADPEYQALAAHRHASATANLALVEGGG